MDRLSIHKARVVCHAFVFDGVFTCINLYHGILQYYEVDVAVRPELHRTFS